MCSTLFAGVCVCVCVRRSHSRRSAGAFCICYTLHRMSCVMLILLDVNCFVPVFCMSKGTIRCVRLGFIKNVDHALCAQRTEFRERLALYSFAHSPDPPSHALHPSLTHIHAHAHTFSFGSHFIFAFASLFVVHLLPTDKKKWTPKKQITPEMDSYNTVYSHSLPVHGIIAPIQRRFSHTTPNIHSTLANATIRCHS